MKMKTKISCLFLAIMLIGGTLTAQSNSNGELPKKISYNFIMEFGNYLSSDGIGFTGVAINSLSLNEQNIFGIGLGYEMGTNDRTAIPLFFNFRHYFNRPGKTIKPLVNFAIGTRLCINKIYDYIEVFDPFTGFYTYQNNEETVFTPGIYGTMTAGFKVKAFSFTSGFFCRTGYSGLAVGFDIKLGFTF